MREFKSYTLFLLIARAPIFTSVHCVFTVCSLCVHCVPSCIPCQECLFHKALLFQIVTPAEGKQTCHTQSCRGGKEGKGIRPMLDQYGPMSSLKASPPGTQSTRSRTSRTRSDPLLSRHPVKQKNSRAPVRSHTSDNLFFLLTVFGEGTCRVVAVLSGETSIVGVPVKEVRTLMRNRNRTELHFRAL